MEFLNTFCKVGSRTTCVPDVKLASPIYIRKCFSACDSGTNVAIKSNTQLWHKQFSFSYPNGISNMVKKGYVKGSMLTGNLVFECSICIARDARRVANPAECTFERYEHEP